MQRKLSHRSQGQLRLLPQEDQAQVLVDERRREIVQALADLLLDAVNAAMVGNAHAEGDDER